MAKEESEEINMKNLFVAVLVFALIVIPYTYYYFPSLNKTNSMRQQIANITASSNRFASGTLIIYKNLLESKKEDYKNELASLTLLIPEFSTTKTNLMSPFDIIREEIPGDWSVVPEGKFSKSNNLVFWPFKFKYIGTNADAVKVLAYMESANQFMRLDSFKIDTTNELVTLSGVVELVFREYPLENNGGEK